MPPELLVIGGPIVVVVPGMVELAKRAGLPVASAGFASIAVCGVVVGLVELPDDSSWGAVATWALTCLVYGLAACELYSQVKPLATGYQLSAGRWWRWG
jgi:hypothetical protein